MCLALASEACTEWVRGRSDFPLTAQDHTPMRLAFAGRIGAGKTSLADRFAEEFGLVKGSFAGALKNEVAYLLGIPRHKLEDRVEKQIWRGLLQEWGRARRRVNPSYWVQKVVASIPPLSGYVIDDLRYLNEAEALRDLGFYLIHLDCPRGDSIKYMVSMGVRWEDAERIAADPSETELNVGGYWTPHLRVSAPRDRSLDDLYEEILRGLPERFVR